MKKRQGDIRDVIFIETNSFCDNRGIFVKTYHQEMFFEMGIRTSFKEEYFSISKKNVIRGMHFQIPPYDQGKIVYCVRGRVLDVVLDLRKDSLTFGKYVTIELSVGSGIVYIPRGFAHGFLSLEDDSTLCYKVETVYNKDNDSGVLWNSFGFTWPVTSPILSSRDESFVPFNEFITPF